jgi:hypothetical protein
LPYATGEDRGGDGLADGVRGFIHLAGGLCRDRNLGVIPDINQTHLMNVLAIGISAWTGRSTSPCDS